MKVQIQKQIGFIIICVAFLASFGNFAFSAGWEYEGYTYWNNVLTTDDIGVYEFDIGNTDYTWYWTNAYTIGFDEDPDNEMRFYDINGGYSKLFIAKFEFTRPITTFQFVTPQMVNHIIDTNSSVRWDYSLDGTNWTTLWRYEGVNNNVLNFGPIETPIQKFMTDANVTQIWIGYCMEKGDSTAYAQSVNFYDEVDDGGLLRVTVGDEFSAGDAYDTSFDDYTLTEITGKGTPAWAAGYAWPGAETGAGIPPAGDRRRAGVHLGQGRPRRDRAGQQGSREGLGNDAGSHHRTETGRSQSKPGRGRTHPGGRPRGDAEQTGEIHPGREGSRE